VGGGCCALLRPDTGRHPGTACRPRGSAV
jgi:hypothetical protein